MRYRLDVVAATVADAVQFAGGWLFDRSVAGWDVTVLLAQPSDIRPLKILGAEVRELDTVLATEVPGRLPQALAVNADVCSRDGRARKGVLRALEDRGIEVVVWGDGWPAGQDHGVDPVLHRLSYAARAFKEQAMVAAGLSPTAVTPSEIFRSGAMEYAPFCADLVPAV